MSGSSLTHNDIKATSVELLSIDQTGTRRARFASVGHGIDGRGIVRSDRAIDRSGVLRRCRCR